jgi:hypothetical protein
MIVYVFLTGDEFRDLRELTHILDSQGAVRSALVEYRRCALQFDDFARFS